MTRFRRLAWLTAVLTWVLIVVGGIVRVSGSGLGCPDWPTCHGQVVPPLVLQAIIESSHRFTASIVSLGIIATAVYAGARYRRNRLVVIPAILAAGLLVVQIALGAFTVELELTPALVTAHLGTALAVFAMTIVTAAAARWGGGSDRRFQIDGFAALALATVVATYVLLLVGAFVIKGAASYACAGWPLCGGGFALPTDGPSILNVAHRLAAGAVAILYLALIVQARPARPGERDLGGLLLGGLILLVSQIAIGAGVVLWGVPPFTAALHLAVASAFWGNLIAVTFLACHPLLPKRATAGERVSEVATENRGASIPAPTNRPSFPVRLRKLVST